MCERPSFCINPYTTISESPFWVLSFVDFQIFFSPDHLVITRGLLLYNVCFSYFTIAKFLPQLGEGTEQTLPGKMENIQQAVNIYGNQPMRNTTTSASIEKKKYLKDYNPLNYTHNSNIILFQYYFSDLLFMWTINLFIHMKPRHECYNLSSNIFEISLTSEIWISFYQRFLTTTENCIISHQRPLLTKVIWDIFFWLLLFLDYSPPIIAVSKDLMCQICFFAFLITTYCLQSI